MIIAGIRYNSKSIVFDFKPIALVKKMEKLIQESYF